MKSTLCVSAVKSLYFSVSFVSLSLCVKALCLNLALGGSIDFAFPYFLCAFVVKMYCIQRHPPVHPLQWHPKMSAADCSRVSTALAATAEPTAIQKCHFGGWLPHIRVTIQREIGTNCNFCESCELLLRTKIIHSSASQNKDIMRHYFKIGDQQWT